jgi:RHS repeat-associated protein
LLQEEGYYPFGLEMKAISSQAATKMQTRYKFNAGTQLEDNFNVDYYETAAREYDAQLGRFTGIDAMSEKTMALTTYQFGGNNPVSFNDPSGLLVHDPGFWHDQHELAQNSGNWNDVENNFDQMDEYDKENGIASLPKTGFGNKSNNSNFWNKTINYGFNLLGDDDGTVDFNFTSKTSKDGQEGLQISYGYQILGTATDLSIGINSNDPNVAGQKNDLTIGSYFYAFQSQKEEKKNLSPGTASFGDLNTYFGTGVGAIESFGHGSIGNNLKFYSSGWRGNGSVETFRVAESARVLGWVSFGLGTVMDIRGMYIYHNNPNSEDAVSPIFFPAMSLRLALRVERTLRFHIRNLVKSISLNSIKLVTG